MPAGDHDLDLAGHLLDLLEDVGAEEHGPALGAHLLQQAHQVQPLAGVDAVEGLVEQQHGRLVHQRGRQLGALPHALGVGGDAPVGGLDQVDGLEGGLGRPTRVHQPVQLARWRARTGGR